MLFSAHPIGADEALRGGLVSEVVRVDAAGGAETAAGSASAGSAASASGAASGAAACSAASATVARGHHGIGDRLNAATQRRVTELARAIAEYSPHIVQLGKAAVLEQVRMLAIICYSVMALVFHFFGGFGVHTNP